MLRAKAARGLAQCRVSAVWELFLPFENAAIIETVLLMDFLGKDGVTIVRLHRAAESRHGLKISHAVHQEVPLRPHPRPSELTIALPKRQSV